MVSHPYMSIRMFIMVLHPNKSIRMFLMVSHHYRSIRMFVIVSHPSRSIRMFVMVSHSCHIPVVQCHGLCRCATWCGQHGVWTGRSCWGLFGSPPQSTPHLLHGWNSYRHQDPHGCFELLQEIIFGGARERESNSEDNNNNEYLECLTRTGPMLTRSLQIHIVKIWRIQHECTRTQTDLHMHAHCNH